MKYPNLFTFVLHNKQNTHFMIFRWNHLVASSSLIMMLSLQSLGKLVKQVSSYHFCFVFSISFQFQLTYLVVSPFLHITILLLQILILFVYCIVGYTDFHMCKILSMRERMKEVYNKQKLVAIDILTLFIYQN